MKQQNQEGSRSEFASVTEIQRVERRLVHFVTEAQRRVLEREREWFAEMLDDLNAGHYDLVREGLEGAVALKRRQLDKLG